FAMRLDTNDGTKWLLNINLFCIMCLLRGKFSCWLEGLYAEKKLKLKRWLLIGMLRTKQMPHIIFLRNKNVFVKREMGKCQLRCLIIRNKFKFRATGDLMLN